MEEMCKNVKSASHGSAAAAAIANVPPPVVVAPETEHFTVPPALHNGKVVHFKLAPTASVAAPATVEPVEELLGSVITHNCPGTRASARVIQKMKQDQTRPMTPPPPEKEHSKKEEKPTQKTPSQIRTGNGRTSWTNVERNCFFDALNEFGKDFEAVAQCINAKLKRRNANSEYSFKTKDQVRQHYYQTYHKICKYVRYSDELKKLAQELYTLINYGEMRRKLQFLTEKHFMKLKPLIYQGQITIRCKGKNIRIKTPSCKALRRLNQLDDSLDDIRLPSKVEVLLSPANMETFGRVQALAQNPRGRIIVPLHKKLVSFIKIFEYKWRSANQRLHEEKSSLYPNITATASSSSGTTSSTTTAESEQQQPPPQPQPTAPVEPSLCFQPKPGVAIHRPLLNITAHLNSIDICLTAYEERMGVKVRSETLGNSAAVAVAASKRPRTESGSEKRSPEAKKPKTRASPVLEKSLEEAVAPLEQNNLKLEAAVKLEAVKLEVCSGDELETHEDLPTSEAAAAAALPPQPPPQPAAATVAAPPAVTAAPAAVARSKRKEAKEAAAAAAARNFKPLLSDNTIKRMRRGWTVSNAADITIGDLYVVLGQDSKVELEYYWCEAETQATQGVPATTTATTTSATSLPYNTNDCDSVERVKAVTTSTVSNKLKHLLLVANLSERVRKRQCNCGHTCDRKRDLVSKAQQLAGANEAAAAGDGTFRTPMLPVRRPIANFIDPVRQLTALTRQKINRQVLVHRRLLPGIPAPRPYDQLSVRQLHNGLFEPIERAGLTTGIQRVGSSEQQQQQHTQHAVAQDMEAVASRGPARDMPNLDVVPPTALNDETLPEAVQDESTTQNFFRGSVSPMHLLRDSTSNARWLEDNINDFSLTSLLGHLDGIDATRDIIDPSSSMSVISESSVDFRHKFQEIAALLQQQEKD
ncbi:protein cramped [Drosophila guanche]|uniref:Blast:Protein cramped n=1 Tax=Drosophila guanche TaxID=7266 RepID=A0A3B0KM55_DROGU|nr:protein cramped [Drosophila guanche]SPP86916.1 blast:Protein cramped [Drosophila guanche]